MKSAQLRVLTWSAPGRAHKFRVNTSVKTDSACIVARMLLVILRMPPEFRSLGPGARRGANKSFILKIRKVTCTTFRVAVTVYAPLRQPCVMVSPVYASTPPPGPLDRSDPGRRKTNAPAEDQTVVRRSRRSRPERQRSYSYREVVVVAP